MVIDSSVVPGWLAGLFWFAWGSCIGSFLNVCIYRMPREQSLVRPRSRCPKCERMIRWYDNIPLVSYALLGGRCRSCHHPILWRYPLVEAVTGLATVATVARFGASTVGAVYLIFLCGLITASFIDFEFQIIPDEISLGGLALGVAASGLVPALHGTDSRWVALVRSVIGGLAGGGLLYGTGVLGDVLFKKESMGGGDVKLMAMAGSILGWKAVVLAFFLAPMLALLPGLFVLLVKRSHVIPYGPFLSLALVAALFYGADVLRATGLEEAVRLLWDYYGWGS
ncbi:MAG: prepilin peptidase [Candidatus Omnitrophica bacterium]|nr:prepilin peptidase [Candidatus Omnitrophota bacterium]